MSSIIPITLVGDNLGKRHRHLNSLVDEAYLQQVPFQTLEHLPERSPVDRIFKIDVANKHKNLDYILQNLKDEDMLYVSRALKCFWLLDSEYSHIFNPTYLEEVLFPLMLTTAVNKTRHWIQLHLRDAGRLQDFYQYYYDKKNFDESIKFLYNCSVQFILNQIVNANILERLTPHSLKVLSERSPQVAKLYFDNFEVNENLVTLYLKEEKEYFQSIKCVLKLNANIYLDIIEKYFNYHLFKPLSSTATKYIMNHYKHRFVNKPELYTSWILDMKTLAKYLTADEIKGIVLKLAQDEYLSSWFSYKNVEPLLKALTVQDRALIKKQVFIDNSFNDKVHKCWAYTTPSSPKVNRITTHVYLDKNNDINTARSHCRVKKRTIKKKSMKRRTVRTMLDELFDRYRCVSFERTLYELRTRILSESSAQNRQYMMLVLVSKSGGRVESVDTLMKLLVKQHRNETNTTRAAIVRSLVKRSTAWRLPPNVWDLVIQFANDLGLDGSTVDLVCSEGLHAVILRDILNNVKSELPVLTAFLNDFTTFAEYSLNAAERQRVCEALPALLLAAADADPTSALIRLNQLLDVFKAYHMRPDHYTKIVAAITSTALRHDLETARPILRSLFHARIARRELFKENFAVIQTDASYLNALKHDAELLASIQQFEELLQRQEFRHDRYLRKLVIYFSEESGLATRHFDVVQRLITEAPHVSLARPTVRLASRKLWPLLLKLDEQSTVSEYRKLAAAIKGNVHVARPPLDISTIGRQVIGVKAVANKVVVCSRVSVNQLIQDLQLWKRGARLAAALSIRPEVSISVSSVLKAVGSLRPAVALRAALRYFRLHGEESDPLVWDAVKPLLDRLDFTTDRYKRLQSILVKNDWIPSSFKLDYWMHMFNIFRNISMRWSLLILIRLRNFLPELDEKFVCKIIDDFLQIEEKVIYDDTYVYAYAHVCVQIIAKYLLLNNSEEKQKNKIKTIAEPFLSRFRCQANLKQQMQLFDNFIFCLKYTNVFLDVNYLPCMPVFETVIKYMRNIMPVEKYFDKYVDIHLTIIYFKSVRQSLKQRPEFFADEQKKYNEGVETLGFIFGKYIGHEAKELQKTYFTSVIELYKRSLMNYMTAYFYQDASWYKLLAFMIKGILDEGSGKEEQLIAEYIFKKQFRGYTDTDKGEISKHLLKTQSQELKFFFYADMEFLW